MKFGVHLPNSGPLADPGNIVLMARNAEAFGYDSVVVHDHVVWGPDDRYHNYAGSNELVDATSSQINFFEAQTTLAYVAAATSRVRLIPGALCLGWRPPALVAREALTLHALSGGRYVLCVCLGDSRRDYAAMHADWDTRGTGMVEKLRFLRAALDSQGPMSFEGTSTTIESEEWKPSPSGLPLWYAGVTNIAVERVGQFCDGWMGEQPIIFERKLAMVQAAALQAGRMNVDFELSTIEPACIMPTDAAAREAASATLEVHSRGDWLTKMYPNQEVSLQKSLMVGSPSTVRAGVQQYADVGLSLLNLHFIGQSLGSLLEQMESFARLVMPAFG